MFIHALHIGHLNSCGQGSLKSLGQAVQWNLVFQPHVNNLATRRKPQWKRCSNVHLWLRVKSLRIRKRKFGAARGAFPKFMEVEMACVTQSPLLRKSDPNAHYVFLELAAFTLIQRRISRICER